jgi:hypothetical protein
MIRSNLLLASMTVGVLVGCAQAPIALKEMGSFHVGGREFVVSGKPVREVVFTPGGVPAKVDPNGVYQVEQIRASGIQFFEGVRKAGGSYRGGRPSQDRHPRQLAHDHDGPQQRPGRRRDPGLAGEAGPLQIVMSAKCRTQN